MVFNIPAVDSSVLLVLLMVCLLQGRDGREEYPAFTVPNVPIRRRGVAGENVSLTLKERRLVVVGIMKNNERPT